MKVIISVLSIDTYPFTELEKSIRETWYNLNEPGFEIFFYYGNHDKNEIIGDKIFTDTSGEGFHNVGHKTIKMFEIIYNNFEFDYIFRTNLSSYVDIKQLKEYLMDKPTNDFYCGSFGEHNGIPFCSGSGYFISKDLVGKVIENKSKWNHSFIDDVSLGLLLHDMGVERTLGRRYDFGTGANLDLSIYHYRCKTEDPSRIGCINNMKYIYNLKK